MPEQWSPDMCRLLAEQWQTKADALPAGQERDLYLLIADGYAGLARIGTCECSHVHLNSLGQIWPVREILLDPVENGHGV